METPPSIEPKKPSALPVMILVIVLLFSLAASGFLYYQNRQLQIQVDLLTTTNTTKISSTPTPQPPSQDTTNWQTYANKDFSFKYPSDWVQQDIQVEGSGYTQEFKSGSTILSLHVRGNYNQTTGKPYATIEEVLGLPYETLHYSLDGQDGRTLCPRAGCENDFSVDFFSKDSKNIITLYLQQVDTVNDFKAQINEGKVLFTQILSTFKFTPSCGTCPQFVPPAPNFCQTGTIIPGIVDSCGCAQPPTCKQN